MTSNCKAKVRNEFLENRAISGGIKTCYLTLQQDVNMVLLLVKVDITSRGRHTFI
jgi:hypothetical protein